MVTEQEKAIDRAEEILSKRNRASTTQFSKILMLLTMVSEYKKKRINSPSTQGSQDNSPRLVDIVKAEMDQRQMEDLSNTGPIDLTVQEKAEMVIDITKKRTFQKKWYTKKSTLERNSLQQR